MANIFEEHYNTKLGKITALGTALILGYFNALLPFERKAAKDAFNLTLQDRGISCGS